MRRGEIWWAELSDPRASEPGYKRPVIIVQADDFNASRLQTVVVMVITSNLRLADAPGNVLLPKTQTGLGRDSVANVSQILTLDKDFLTEQVGTLSRKLHTEVDRGLRYVLGF